MKTKKIVSIIIVCILILLGGQVYAAPEATVTIECEEKAKSGDEISVNLKVNVSSAGEGVEGIIAEIEYPAEVLTMLTPESSEVTIMDGMLMVALDEPIPQGERTITIKFMVKNNITQEEATIKFADVILTDADKTTKEIGTIQKTIKINEEETPGGDEPPTEKTLSSIEITKLPNKIDYTEGERFDKTGMVIKAQYSDGTEKEVTDYTYSPEGKLGEDDKKIIISYTENGITKTDEIEITVKEEASQGDEPGKDKPQPDKDGTEADKDIPDTGVENIIIPAIIIAIIGIAGYVGYRKNNI